MLKIKAISRLYYREEQVQRQEQEVKPGQRLQHGCAALDCTAAWVCCTRLHCSTGVLHSTALQYGCAALD